MREIFEVIGLITTVAACISLVAWKCGVLKLAFDVKVK